MERTPVIDHFQEMKECLYRVGNLLYIGDNFGEIVFDRLFMKEILFMPCAGCLL